MSTARRKRVAAVTLLIVTAILWLLAALFKGRVTPFFHAVLIKRIVMAMDTPTSRSTCMAFSATHQHPDRMPFRRNSPTHGPKAAFRAKG